jgi:hypothetical protein
MCELVQELAAGERSVNQEREPGIPSGPLADGLGEEIVSH